MWAYLVNLAIAYQLLGQPEDAIIYAGRALRLGGNSGALLARGIARAQQGNSAGARADFEEAGKEGHALAGVNLEVLAGRPAARPSPPTAAEPELLAGKNPADATLALGGTVRRLAASGEGPALEIRYREHPTFTALRVAAGDRWIQFLWTAPGYAGETSLGLKPGTPESGLSVHGAAAESVSSPGGRFHHFKERRLLVQVVDGRVAGWSVYALPPP
ncbi:MAG: hypothetical protein FJW40_11370 [Acidobacteria bacterium]|nr:hypothetical protein [Acidobacteriota bacterium]